MDTHARLANNLKSRRCPRCRSKLTQWIATGHAIRSVESDEQSILLVWIAVWRPSEKGFHITASRILPEGALHLQEARKKSAGWNCPPKNSHRLLLMKPSSHQSFSKKIFLALIKEVVTLKSLKNDWWKSAVIRRTAHVTFESENLQ